MKKEIDAVGNVVNAAAKGKIQEKLKVRQTKKKAAKAVTKGFNQGKKTGKKAVKETKKTIKALKKGKIQKKAISQATNVASQTVRLASLNVPASAISNKVNTQAVSYTHLTLPTKA